jgi:GT2 family glycosyltransferase
MSQLAVVDVLPGVSSPQEPRPGLRLSRPARVAVVLVNYLDYGRAYLADCYASLAAQTYPADRLTVFMVDNGTTPEIAALVGRLAPGARLLHNPVNLGWGGGNNTAIRVAMQEGVDYLVMLNMDTIVASDWLERLVEAAARKPDVHIFQSKLLLHGTTKLNSLGNRIHYLGYGYCNGYGREDAAASAMTVDYASGAAMLIRREVFERIGLFREDYFLYYDDMEFCWRARLAGFNVGLADQSVCHHKYDFTAKLGMVYYLERNRLLTVLTLERVPTLLLTAPCLIVSGVVVAACFIVRGWVQAVWELARYFSLRSTWRSILAHRRKIGALRVRKDAEIVRGFAGRIVFAEIDHPILRYLVNPLLQGYWAIIRIFIVW